MKVDTSFRGHIISPSQVLEEKSFPKHASNSMIWLCFFQITPPLQEWLFDLITFDC